VPAVHECGAAGTDRHRFDVEHDDVDDRAERFGRLFDACYRPLNAYARRRVSRADADDLVADVFTVVWRRLDDVPADATLPWMYGVAHRLLANQRRAAERRSQLNLKLHLERAATTASHDDEAADAIRSALTKMQEGDQEILRLWAWEQLGPAEIALVLGCTANAAALRLSRARQRLRAVLTGIPDVRTSPRRKVSDA